MSFQFIFTSSLFPLDFPGGSVLKNPPVNAGDARDPSSTPGTGRSSGVGNGKPLQYYYLGNSMEFLHGNFYMVVYSPWGCKESDTTEHARMTLPLVTVTFCRE